MRPLYKTIIVIWSEFDGSEVEIDVLAREAIEGDAICVLSKSILIPDPDTDDTFADTGEFFDLGSW